MSNPNAMEVPTKPLKATDAHGDATTAQSRLSTQVTAERQKLSAAELSQIHAKMAPKGGTDTLPSFGLNHDGTAGQSLHPTKYGPSGTVVAEVGKGGKPGPNHGEHPTGGLKPGDKTAAVTGPSPAHGGENNILGKASGHSAPGHSEDRNLTQPVQAKQDVKHAVTGNDHLKK